MMSANMIEPLFDRDYSNASWFQAGFIGSGKWFRHLATNGAGRTSRFRFQCRLPNRLRDSPRRGRQHADTFPPFIFSVAGGFAKYGVSLNVESSVSCSVIVAFLVQAEAHPRHYRHQRLLSVASFVSDNQSDERTVSGRPSGCPHAFCGCEASLFRFGRIIPQLNLASNWRRFPRAAPAAGMAAVRSGHIMILQRQVAGDIWYVHDGNSGGHVTREHPRSIAGYTIVDPSSASWVQAAR